MLKLLLLMRQVVEVRSATVDNSSQNGRDCENGNRKSQVKHGVLSSRGEQKNDHLLFLKSWYIIKVITAVKPTQRRRDII